MKHSLFDMNLRAVGILLIGGLALGCAMKTATTGVQDGQVVVGVAKDGRVTLDANQAPRGEIFQELAKQGGFEVVAHRRVEGSEAMTGPVSLHLRGVTVEQAVAAAADGLPYFLSYGVDPDTSRHVLQTVAVGLGGAQRAAHLEYKKVRQAEREKRKQERERQRENQQQPAAPSPSEQPAS